MEEEVAIREASRFRNALKLSGLPHRKGLDEFDFPFQPELEARKVRDLGALSFVKERANVCLLGPPGVGKTHCETAYTVRTESRGRIGPAAVGMTRSLIGPREAVLSLWICLLIRSRHRPGSAAMLA